MTSDRSEGSIPTAPEAPDVIRIPQKDILTAGSTLSRRYILRECLGKGGMGAVYRAFDLELQEDIALKVVLPERMGDPDAVERLRREVKLARNVSHPHVCRVFDLGESEGSYFLTMQLVRGRTLREMLARGSLEPATALDLLDQIADGLSAMHAEGILHRDLKPENVLVRDDARALVADFGIARRPRGEKATTTGGEGTPPYMSPEQLRGEPIGKASDLFSLGVVGFEMLAGKLPFGQGTHAVIVSAILEKPPDRLVVPRLGEAATEALGRVLERAMAKRPEERFASVGEFREALATAQAQSKRALTTDSAAAMPSNALAPPPPPAAALHASEKNRKSAIRRAGTILLSVTIASAVGALGWRLWAGARPNPPAMARTPPGSATASSPAGPPTVLVEPFENLSGAKEWDGLASSAAGTLRTGLQAVSGLRVPASSEGRTANPTWVVRGSVQTIGGALRLAARFEPRGEAIASEIIEIDGSPDRVPQMLDGLRSAAVDEARLVLRYFQRRQRAFVGTANDEARAKLLSYYTMVGPSPRREHFDVGLRLLDEALEADASYAPALVERGYLASIGAGPGSAAEQTARAVADVNRAVQIDPGNGDARVMRCRVLQVAIEAGSQPTDAAIERAVDACTVALQVEPSSAFVRIALARIEDRRCRDDEAMRLLEASVELDRSLWGRALKHLVSLAVQNDRLELADRTTERLVALAEEEKRLGPRALSRRAGLPPVPAAHFWRGVVLFRLGRLDEAKQAFVRELSQISPGPTVSKSTGAFEAAAILGLLRIAAKRGEQAPPELARRYSRIEAQYRADNDPDGTWVLASALAFVDPKASTMWIEGLSPADSCDQAVQRAYIYRAAGEFDRARKAVAPCTPAQAWERSCVDRLRSLSRDK